MKLSAYKLECLAAGQNINVYFDHDTIRGMKAGDVVLMDGLALEVVNLAPVYSTLTNMRRIVVKKRGRP